MSDKRSMTIEAEADPERYLVWVTVPLTFEFAKWASDGEAAAVGAKVLHVARAEIAAVAGHPPGRRPGRERLRRLLSADSEP